MRLFPSTFVSTSAATLRAAASSASETLMRSSCHSRKWAANSSGVAIAFRVGRRRGDFNCFLQNAKPPSRVCSVYGPYHSDMEAMSSRKAYGFHPVSQPNSRIKLNAGDAG
jgi:hypothetical protein